MEKYLIVAVVLVICIGIVVYTQMASGTKLEGQSLKQAVQKAFPKYKVIEKQGTIMICEINHRNEPDELVFIRIDPNQKKNIRNFGRRATITYSQKPSMKEIKKDVIPYLD